MDRRAFFGTLAGSLLAAPFAAEAQQTTKVYRIGFISPTSPGPTSLAFREGLRGLGYVEGQNVILETRFAEGRFDHFPKLVAEMIGLKVDVLVVGSSLGSLAAKRATTSRPIVCTGVIDPVASGIVTSLARPGGNITGITFGIFGEGFGGKWVELLKEAAPDVSHVAALWYPAYPSTRPLVPEMQAAARSLNVRLDLIDAGRLTKLDSVCRDQHERRSGHPCDEQALDVLSRLRSVQEDEFSFRAAILVADASYFGHRAGGAKVGLTVPLMLADLASATNYAERVPSSKWLPKFVELLAVAVQMALDVETSEDDREYADQSLRRLAREVESILPVRRYFPESPAKVLQIEGVLALLAERYGK